MIRRRAIRDTLANRKVLDDLGYTYIPNAKKKQLFIKVSGSDYKIIRWLMPDKSYKRGD